MWGKLERNEEEFFLEVVGERTHYSEEIVILIVVTEDYSKVDVGRIEVWERERKWRGIGGQSF